MNIRYEGRRVGARPVEVTVAVDDRTPQPLPHIVRHSPDGFEWGYGGSGPSDLALSILVHFGVTAYGLSRAEASNWAEGLYMQFKFHFLAAVLSGRQSWSITASAIEGWLRDINYGRYTAPKPQEGGGNG